MPNEFWSGWIIVLTVLSLVGLTWLVLSVYFLPRAGHGEEADQVWDGDLREGNSPAPLWWFCMILGALVFTVIYLMLYPGLGSFQGALRWTQGHHVEHSYHDYQETFGAARAELAARPLQALQAEPELMAAAAGLFSQHCAACHGENAQGQANLFPNLRDGSWQWGGSPEQVEQSIRSGRNAMMVSWQAPLQDEGVQQVADYVLTLADGGAAEHPGQLRYQQFCIACHGVDGGGNPLLGAPSLKDAEWLYGGDLAAVRSSIADGRNGQMPAFGERLDDLQIRLLVAWLLRPAAALTDAR